MKRISALTLLILLVLAYPALTVGYGANATSTPDHIALSWTGNPSTTMTITWRTDASVTNGFVQYQKGDALTDRRARENATVSDFTTGLQQTKIFTATLTHLSPNASYSYRVGDGTHWSDIHKFSTADPSSPEFKFLIFGDSQSPATNYSLWGQNVHNAYKANPDAKFIVNVGDIVDEGQSGTHWNSWFAASAGVIDTIPEMAVVGNHETYGSPDTTRPAYWTAQFRMPQNGPEGLKNQVYSYDYGCAHIVVLDSQATEQKQYGDILASQKTWLDKDLSASKATWKFVFFHKTPYELKISRPNPDVKSAFCEVMESHHVDVVFNGHDHGVGRSYPIRDGAYRTKPSQGTVYFITGRGGAKTYTDIIRKPWTAFFYNPLDQPNYLVVDASPAKLTVKTVKMDGTVVDTFFIDKSKDVDSDLLKR